MVEFTTNLKKFRVLQDLTQDELAKRVGVRRETIMRLEKAKYNPSLELAVRLSRELAAPLTELFNFDFSDEEKNNG